MSVLLRQAAAACSLLRTAADLQWSWISLRQQLVARPDLQLVDAWQALVTWELWGWNADLSTEGPVPVIDGDHSLQPSAVTISDLSGEHGHAICCWVILQTFLPPMASSVPLEFQLKLVAASPGC